MAAQLAAGARPKGECLLSHAVAGSDAVTNDASGQGKPRHLLFVSSPFTRLTGADRDWVTLCHALDPERYRVTWVGCEGCSYIRPLLPHSVVPRMVEIPLPVFHQMIQEQQSVPRSLWLWTKIVLRFWQHNRAAARALEAALGQDVPELVVTNSAALWVGAFYARRRKLPHFWAVKEWFNPACKPSRLYARALARWSQCLTVPSRACAQAFPAAAAWRVHVVPDGNDVPFILRQAQGRSRREVLEGWGLPPERPLLAQVGALQHWKGQHITVAAWQLLAAGGGEPPCSLVFLGGGSAQDVAHTRAQLQALPAAWRDAVRLEKYAPDDFAPLAAADAVVHPSVLPDPLPNAVREALILGKPVIGSDGGGVPDMVRPGENGLLVPPGDAAALAEAIEQLMGDAAQRQALGEAAARWARPFFEAKTRTAGFTALMDRFLPS